jgi:hypothetical protein
MALCSWPMMPSNFLMIIIAIIANSEDRKKVWDKRASQATEFE